MRTGVYVFCFFAAVWGCFALAGLGLPAWSWIAPVLVSMAVAAFAAPRADSGAGRSPEESRRVDRLIGLWSGVEGVAIPVAILALANTGHARQIMPAIAVIVGLHLLPIAHGLRYGAYYVGGAALSLAGVAAMFAPGPSGPQVAAGTAGALILWATSLAIPMLARAKAR